MSDDCPKCEGGLAPWMATFADMMSLLMCFFVLLLSFAEVDAVRFKKMADAMKDAFGVQREVPATEVVKGTSVIMQDFSPGKPEPTPEQELRQQSADVEKKLLEKTDQSAKEMDFDAAKAAMRAKQEQETKARAGELKGKLDKEISQGLLQVETAGTRIIIRIQEKGSFPSGSANLDPDFFTVISKISDVIAHTPGRIIVAGHTDDVPISTKRFRSNWELSSARAVTVVHAMLSNAAIDERRFLVEGFADSQPLVPNDSKEHRALNRRVELIIRRGEDVVSSDVNKADQADQAEMSPVN